MEEIFKHGEITKLPSLFEKNNNFLQIGINHKDYFYEIKSDMDIKLENCEIGQKVDFFISLLDSSLTELDLFDGFNTNSQFLVDMNVFLKKNLHVIEHPAGLIGSFSCIPKFNLNMQLLADSNGSYIIIDQHLNTTPPPDNLQKVKFYLSQNDFDKLRTKRNEHPDLEGGIESTFIDKMELYLNREKIIPEIIIDNNPNN